MTRRETIVSGVATIPSLAGITLINKPEPFRQVFKQDHDGKCTFWRLIAWEQMEPGDCILCVGDILQKWIIGPKGVGKTKEGLDNVDVVYVQDLLIWDTCYPPEG